MKSILLLTSICASLCYASDVPEKSIQLSLIDDAAFSDGQACGGETRRSSSCEAYSESFSCYSDHDEVDIDDPRRLSPASARKAKAVESDFAQKIAAMTSKLKDMNVVSQKPKLVVSRQCQTEEEGLLQLESLHLEKLQQEMDGFIKEIMNEKALESLTTNLVDIDNLYSNQDVAELTSSRSSSCSPTMKAMLYGKLSDEDSESEDE